MTGKSQINLAAALLTLSVGGASACAAETQTGDAPLGSESSSLLAAVDLVWPQSDPFGYLHVPVCWNTSPFNFDGQREAKKRLVRAAVEDTWMRVAQINFYGWEECKSGSAPPGGFAIDSFYDLPWPPAAPGRSSSPVGVNAVGRSMQLNFSRSPEFLADTAVHEFGHALGFIHEQLRPEIWQNLGPCLDEIQSDQRFFENNGYRQQSYGIWDLESIMNYCQPGYGRRPEGALDRLGPTDVLGGATYYNPKPNGSVVGIGGRCIHVHGGAMNEGARVTQWECRDVYNVTWSYSPVTGYLRSDGASSDGRGMCLTRDRITQDVGISACGAAPARQEYSFVNTLIRYAGKCLTRTAVGVVLEPCSSDRLADQRFRLRGDGRISEMTAGRNDAADCLTVPSDVEGAAVVMAACKSGGRQLWSIREGGEIVLDGTDRCLDLAVVPAGNNPMAPYNNNSWARTVRCSAGVHERFVISGNLYNETFAEYLVVDAESSSNGVPIRSLPMPVDGNGRRAMFDYYPSGSYQLPGPVFEDPPVQNRLPLRSQLHGLAVQASWFEANGDRVDVRVHGTNPKRQEWVFEADGTIRSNRRGKCLEVEDASLASGAYVSLNDCHGGSNQRWTWENQGQIRNHASGKCLEIEAASAHEGAVLVQGDCRMADHQRWYTFHPYGDGPR